MVNAEQQKSRNERFGWGIKNLAATYSRGSYTTTTIGKTVFDGRVRNGNGSDHSFMATKKDFKFQISNLKFQRACSLKTTHRTQGALRSRIKIALLVGALAVEPLNGSTLHALTKRKR